MTTTEQEQRLRRRFDLWDRDNNGRIERSDWEAETERLLHAFGESADSPKGRELTSAYLGMWDQLASQAGVKSGESLDFDQFKSVAAQQLEQGKAGFQQLLQPTIKAILNLCDTDGDGQVSIEEFQRWIKAADGDESRAAEAFRRIDTDGSGHLSVEELTTAVEQFHSGELDFSLL